MTEKRGQGLTLLWPSLLLCIYHVELGDWFGCPIVVTLGWALLLLQHERRYLQMLLLAHTLVAVPLQVTTSQI